MSLTPDSYADFVNESNSHKTDDFSIFFPATWDVINQLHDDCFLHSFVNSVVHNLCIIFGIVSVKPYINNYFDPELNIADEYCDQSKEDYDENICIAYKLRRIVTKIVLDLVPDIRENGVKTVEKSYKLIIDTFNRFLASPTTTQYERLFFKMKQKIEKMDVFMTGRHHFIHEDGRQLYSHDGPYVTRSTAFDPNITTLIAFNEDGMQINIKEYLDAGYYGIISESGPILDILDKLIYLGDIPRNFNYFFRTDGSNELNVEQENFMDEYVENTKYKNGDKEYSFTQAMEETKQNIINHKESEMGGHVMLVVQIIRYKKQWWVVVKNTWGNYVGIGGYHILPLNLFHYFNLTFIIPVTNTSTVEFVKEDFDTTNAEWVNRHSNLKSYDESIGIGNNFKARAKINNHILRKPNKSRKNKEKKQQKRNNKTKRNPYLKQMKKTRKK